MDISKIKVSGTLYDIKDATARGSLSTIDGIVQNLAAVATSGSYADLSNKPTIGSGVLTIQKNGTTVDTFNANATADKTISIVVPTKVSDLTNDTGFITSSSIATVMDWKGTKATVSALPSSGNKSGDVWHVTADNMEYAWNGSDWEPLGSSVDLSGYATTASLATVATSGSYNDLSNKPTIPTVNNAALTIQKNSTTVKTFTANASSAVNVDITMQYGGTTGTDAETLILNVA